MSSCTDHYLTQDKAFEAVQIIVSYYGHKQHLEFPEEHILSGAIRGIIDPGERAVFGYLAFGQVFLSNFIQWYPSDFINWGQNVFLPPNRFCNVIRIWTRFGVHAQVIWSAHAKNREHEALIFLQNYLLQR